MKNNLLVLVMMCIVTISNAQWNQLEVPTENNLHDVDFLDDNYGVVVGDNGTALLTVDGGEVWTDINDGAIFGNIHSVKVLGVDAIVLSTWDPMNTSGEIHITSDGGANWENVMSPVEMNHRVELGSNNGSTIFSAAKNLMVSENSGANWETLVMGIGGMTSLDQLEFASEDVGHLSGLISGFINYSAYFYRTEDAGENWYAGDAFLFPNADALSTMCFTDPNTAYVFTNAYQNWMPSDQNGLVKIYDFELYEPFPGSGTVWSFESEIVNDQMPAYMHDAFFTSGYEGFAVAEDGNIYLTTDAGVNWESDYEGDDALKMVSFTENTAYAAGANGTVVKKEVTSGIAINEISEISVYPNPTTDKVKFINPSAKAGVAKIYDMKGRVLIEEKASYGVQQIDVADLPQGLYLLSVTFDNGRILRSNFVKR